MATTSEVTLLIKARDEASATLARLNRQLGDTGKQMGGIGKTADDLRKKFAGGQLFGSIMSGLGIGSGMQIVQMLSEAIAKPWKDAAEAAKIVEATSVRTLEHTKRMMALRRGELTDAQRLAELQKEAEGARGDFNSANAPQYRIKSGFFGNFLGNEVIEKTKEQKEAIDELQKKAEAAEEALLKFSKSFQAAGIDRALTDFFTSVERGAERIDDAMNTSLRDFFYTLDNPPDLAGVNQELARFFDSVEAGAEVIQEKMNLAIRDFFYTIDNAPEARPTALQRARGFANEARGGDSVAGGVELGLQSTVAGLGTTAEQVAGAIQNTLGSAVYAISDGIAGWASGMMSFGDAANQIWTNFKMAALQAFTDMVAQYAVKKAAMFAIDVLFSAKGLALQLASAAKSLIAWIPSAIAASISSFGTAALVGAAAVAAVIAATGGFADGGMVNGPGSGTSDSILARLSNGEYVMPAAAVQRIGERNLDAMAYGAASPAAAMASGGGGMGGRGATILVDNRREADRFRRGSPMETQIVQVMQANRYRVAHT